MNKLEETPVKSGQFGQTIQVRLVSDFKKSQDYYQKILGCEVDDWGHAKRDGMLVILQQAVSPEDVRPNAVSKKRRDYPTEWEGPDFGWDTYIHVSWEDLDLIVEEISDKGGHISARPFLGSHGKWEFKNACLKDPDGYAIVLGSMREKNKNSIVSGEF